MEKEMEQLISMVTLAENDTTLRKVTSEEFFKNGVGPLDVILRITNDRYPYRTEFRLRNSDKLIGVAIGEGHYYLKNK